MSLSDVIIKENGLLLNEAAVATSKDNVLSVGVTLDKSRDYGDNCAYFKCIRGTDFSTNVARISFRVPEYIVHNKKGPQVILTRKEKKILLELLNSQYRNTDKTVWQALIELFNNIITDYGKTKSKYILPIDLPIPDYIQLKGK